MQDKRFEMRIDKNLDKNVISFCNKNKITKAFLIKSILLYFFKKDNKEKILFKDEEFKKNLLYEFRRFGNNLNQIAYKLNLAAKSNNLSADDNSLVKQALEDHKELNRKFRELRSLIAKRL